MVSLIWATRGRSWGFQFLLDGGYPDPLLVYERAFEGTQGQRTVCRPIGDSVAVRFPDPLNRSDDAGRAIPHEFVLTKPQADRVHSIDDALREIWPLVAGVFGEVWDRTKPPATQAIRTAMGEK